MRNYSMAWLDYKKASDEYIYRNKDLVKNIGFFEENSYVKISLEELNTAINFLFDIKPEIQKFNTQGIIIGTVNEGYIKEKISDKEKENLKDEGFIIKNIRENEEEKILITSLSQKGLVYGTFEFIKLMQLEKELKEIYIFENPKTSLRMINHWDNMDGSIERGYAGGSILFSDNKINLFNIQRLKDYARLLSSLGINGVVLNNVNVRGEALYLITEKHLPDLSEMAEIFRNYGIKIYLSINFMSPVLIGGLSSADPLNKEVLEWWKERVKTIYKYIPDFGGFLVKADSEFNPGPHNYGRTHADGANMLAEALEPYGGIVIWRAFVYNLQDWRDLKTDRARSAYDIFKPLDGKFASNVFLQIKNGPMDFQVREPVSPLFGGLYNTNEIIELQITQEYTGQQIDLCYLGPMWKEVLEFDTYAQGKGSKVKYLVKGFAGVSNIGSDYYWTGHPLAQANLYVFSKFSWDYDLFPEEIAKEWCQRSITKEDFSVRTIVDLLMKSWRVYEMYTTPLGLGWMVNPGSHYGPNPEGYEYSFWGTYHRADNKAIGRDRSVKTGTGFAGQYHKENAELYENIETCPEELLLFFHRVPYTYVLKSGKTLIQYIYDSHFEGVEEVEKMIEEWKSLKGLVPEGIYNEVLDRFNRQLKNAIEWRDVINNYFYRKSGIPDEHGRKIY